MLDSRSSLQEIRAQLKLEKHLGFRSRDLKDLILQWKSGKTSCPPTWKSLLSVLKDLGLKKLHQQIQDYFHGEWEVTCDSCIMHYKNRIPVRRD